MRCAGKARPFRPIIRAVIFDFDGVLRLWPEADVELIERRTGIPVGSISASAFAGARLESAILGQISHRSWHEQVAAELGTRFGPAGRQAADDWSRLRGRIDPAMLALVHSTRQVARVALLSNATTALREELASLGVDKAFDVVAISAELGVAKPDPGAFCGVTDLLGLPPHECVIVDDDHRNVAAARALGFTVIHHESVRSTGRHLEALVLRGEPV